MSTRTCAIVATIAATAAIVASSPSRPVLAGAPASSEPQLVDDGSLKARFAVSAGADVLPTTRTIPHWWGSAVDPNNGVTYGYNMGELTQTPAPAPVVQ